MNVTNDNNNSNNSNNNDIANQIFHPEDETDYFDPADMQSNKAVAILASFPVLFWLPLVAAQGSAYGKFCANQGLILFAGGIVLNIVDRVLGTVLNFVPFVGDLFGGLLSLVVGLAELGAFLLLLVSACQGKARRIPLVGHLFEAFQ